MLGLNPRIPTGVEPLMIQHEVNVRDALNLGTFKYSKVEALKSREGVEILAFYGEREDAGKVALRECTISALTNLGFSIELDIKSLSSDPLPGGLVQWAAGSYVRVSAFELAQLIKNKA